MQLICSVFTCHGKCSRYGSLPEGKPSFFPCTFNSSFMFHYVPMILVNLSRNTILAIRSLGLRLSVSCSSVSCWILNCKSKHGDWSIAHAGSGWFRNWFQHRTYLAKLQSFTHLNSSHLINYVPKKKNIISSEGEQWGRYNLPGHMGCLAEMSGSCRDAARLEGFNVTESKM